MAIGRREALALAASALLGACAIEPPPKDAAPYATRAAQAPRPSADQHESAPSAPLDEPDMSALPDEPEVAGSATPTPEPPGEAVPVMGTAGTNHNAAASAYAVPAATVHHWLATGTGPAAKTAFLTFDDGPSVLTPQVLDTLAQLRVPATFFVIGRLLEHGASITQRAIKEGHAVCLHSYSHDYAYLYPGRVGNAVNIASDYDHALVVATQALGPTYASGGYRYPGGHMSWKGLEDADAALGQRGVTWIDWNCMSGDADRKPPATPDEAMLRLTTTFAASGSPSAAVMLNHDKNGEEVTLAALPQFVQFFRERGYGFGVIS